MSDNSVLWLCIGFAGQALFTSRFLVQWIASERKGESIFPVAFWYLSLTGGLLLLAYAISRVDPVIIAGQALGVVVYGRNLVLVHRKRSQLATLQAVAESNEPCLLPVGEAAPAELRKAG